MREKTGEVDCMGCGLNCKIDFESKGEKIRCTEKQFAVWPEDNFYFKRAVNDLVFKSLPCFLPKGIIIVDFSIDNILSFIHE